MAMLGEHAVVLGASMSGMLAARVLTDHYSKVTLVERDVLTDEPGGRRGVPQGRHPHALLARGADTLRELFPGMLDDMVADGAPVWDDGELSKLYLSFGGHVVTRSGKAAVPDPRLSAMYFASRPFLESHVRRRLQTCADVEVIAGHDVTELVPTADRSRVTGVRIADRHSGAARQLDADLVVDATGRASRAPVFLENLGYGRPVEDHIVVNTTYMSQSLRIPAGTVHEVMAIVSPAPGRPTGAFLVRNERDTWLFTAFGMIGHEPPRNLPGMVAFVEELLPAHLLAAVRSGEPCGPVVQHRLPSSQWRRYEKMRRFPDGLLITGDAMCSLNPIYGQGMSVAAMDALALRNALRHGEKGLSQRYFRAAAKSIGVAWQLGAGTDLSFPEVQGRRTAAMRLSNRYAEWVLSACEIDAVINTQFSRVTGLVDPPARLFRPSFVYRVASVNNRRRKQRRTEPVAAGVAS
jgi:2-polyprenyl-6-methoxyphenol hydroxylase-like FAD-dependent oxidoreductase